MIRRYSYRCYPTAEQVGILARTFGCCRVVYNWALQRRTEEWANGRRLTHAATDLELTEYKKRPDRAWLKEVSSVALQQVLRHLQTAFVGFFEKRTGYPTFKRRGRHDAASYSRSAFRIKKGQLYLAKMGHTPLRVRWSRDLPSPPTTATITRHPSGRYYVSFVVEVSPPAATPTGAAVGIDFGIARLATLSTGETVANPRHGRKRERQLAQAQKSFARKKRVTDPETGHRRDSNRRAKARQKVARVHERIADARRDTLHKFTSSLVQRFDTIYIEDLHLRGMVKNHSLARSLHDASIGAAVRMIEYKAAASGKTVRKVDRWFPSSKLCSACGHLLDNLPLGTRSWACPTCGATHDRDVNAALNILAVGLTVTARGGGVRAARGMSPGRHRPAKREPPTSAREG